MSTPSKKEILSCLHVIQFEWTLQNTGKHRRPDNDTVLPWLLANYVLGFVNRNLKFFPFFEKDRLPIRLDRLAKFNEIFEIFG